MIKHFKFFNILIISLLFFLLIISFHEYFGFHLNRYYPDFYSYECNYKMAFKQYTECQSQKFLYKSVWIENGLVENLQLIFLISAIIAIIYSIAKYNIKKTIYYFLLIKFLGLSFIFFEETSWLQHFLSFKTPDVILNINHQKEFNLHNISRIFNEIPRTLVLIWCCFGSLSYFFLKNKINEEIKMVLLPSNKLIFISFMLIFFTLPNIVVDKFGLLNWNNLHINYAGNPYKHEMHMIFSPLIKEGFNLYQFMIILFSSNYFRFSEFQELIFYYYFFSHTIFFTYKLKYINENSNNHIRHIPKS